jgi:hypothetical protein
MTNKGDSMADSDSNPFEHAIQRDDFDEVERLLAAERAKPKIDAKTAAAKKKQSLVEMLAGSDDTAALARRFNMDPDMSEKVMVPVLNFLDKYGVGESISGSNTGQTAASILEFLTDITPVVRNAMDYFGGRQRELSQEDRDFLEQIKSAQSGSGDMGLFIGETVGEEVAPEPVVQKPTATQKKRQPGQIPTDRDIFTEGVDWAEVLNPTEVTREEVFTETVNDTFLVSGLEKLAAEAGLDMDNVMLSDRQAKTNNHGRVSKEIDYSKGGVNLDLGLEKINEAMKLERQKVSHQSKVTFKESENMPVPQNLTDGNPQDAPNYTIPTFAGQLESVEEMMARTEIPEEEEPWVGEDFNPDDYDIGYAELPEEEFEEVTNDEQE